MCLVVKSSWIDEALLQTLYHHLFQEGRHPDRWRLHRRVIGWALDWTMDNTLTLSALRMALSRRVVGPDLVHHSDRGSQYASGDYTDLLKENGIAISMSRKGNPWDNAACESFMKTRLAMCHPQSSKLTSSDNKRKPLRDRFLDEFFQASGNLSIRCDSIGPGTASLPSPASSSR